MPARVFYSGRVKQVDYISYYIKLGSSKLLINMIATYISVDLKLDTLCLSLFYCQQDLSVYFISIIGASGDTDDSAFVVLWDNHHVVTSRPMDSAIMEQPASLITQCQ
ncbi:hypothetical protein YC2023_030354 [Brassica napus]